MTVAKLRPTIHQRVANLEQRADKNDVMAEQFAEIYEAWRKVKTINWFLVKLFAGAGAVLGFVAVVLTIAGNAAKLFGH